MLNNNLNTSEKMDSINITPKGNSKELNKNDETIKGNPLANKKWGIEFNLFRFLTIASISRKDGYDYSFSGGVSLFNISRGAELAFPIYFSNFKDKGDWEYDEEYKRQFTLDCHYRIFFGLTQKGFYFSGFIRYANLCGTKGEYSYYEYVLKRSTENKIGIGFGFGYRVFSQKGLYWGVSLSIGRYFIGENDIFEEEGDLLLPFDDHEMIVIFELLKFGWAF